MSETKNTLRQADAIITVEGLLAEKNLEATTTADGKEIIRGSLTLKTSDTNTIPLNVYVNKLTTKGEPNRAYAGMETVIREYQSIAEAGEEEATKVRCGKGQLQPNTYINRDGDAQSGVRYGASFVSRVDEIKTPFDPRAEFELEVFIENIINETDKEGEETGRLKVGVYVPTYNGIEPMQLIVPEDIASDFEGMFEVGQTTRLFGELKNKVVVKDKVVKIALGKAPDKKDFKYINELVVTGAAEAYEEESAQAYKTEDIQTALTERELKIEEDKKKAAQTKSQSTKEVAKANKPANGKPLPKFQM